jgi:serine/threonine protein kinase
MMSSDAEFTQGEGRSYFTIPVLVKAEVRCGTFLGRGSFCKVSAIKTISLKETLPDDAQEEVRKRFALRFQSSSSYKRRNNNTLAIFGKQGNEPNPMTQQPRMAMKELMNISNKNLKTAQDDLKRECDILRSIREHTGFHPYIIELYAIGVETLDCYKDEVQSIQPNFLILSKIRATLKNFIYKWRERRGLGVYEFLGISIKESQDLWLERLIVLSRIADALQFLHQHGIIFRDLKSENIGFDADDVPKIFDFGLAKQIGEQEYDDKIKDSYKLTGNTGTLRYMPPEVALDQPYGMTVDVYSLSILMHEVLSLQVPFAGIPPSEFRHEVFVQGVRPPIDQGWPLPLQQLLASMWNANPKSRPTMEQVFLSLTGMLRGSDAELFPEYILM